MSPAFWLGQGLHSPSTRVKGHQGEGPPVLAPPCFPSPVVPSSVSSPQGFLPTTWWATNHSLLVLKEVFRSLAVPYHSGSVVLQRLYVPREIRLRV